MKKLILLLLLVFLAAAPAYAQKSFDMRYKEAVEYYTKKQFDMAIKVLDAAKKSPGVTKDQISKANRLRSQCLASKQKLSDLNLSKESVYAGGAGQKDSIYVTAGKAWEVTSAPSWCDTWTEADVLFIEVEPNSEHSPRNGIIEVSMGKERTAYIMVNQEKRLDISCPVRVLTRPERAMVYIDNNQGMLSEDFVLDEGKHRIRIEKSGFERRDTTVVISEKNQDGAVFEFALKPLFATISVDIRPVEGYAFDSNPGLDISGNEVNLYPNVVKRFNVDQDISYYSLYDGNVIPLHPGQYVLKASADGFVSEKKIIEAVRAENQHFEFRLAPVCGTLSVSDEENAAGALVYVDGKEAGTVPFGGLTLKKGLHKIRLEKAGFISDDAEYEVEVLEDKNTDFKAVMQRFSEYSITSEPPYSRVFVDDVYIGTTPLQLNMREGDHVLKVEKNGYYPVVKNITPALDGQAHELALTLENSYPLLITADKDSLDIIVSKGAGKNRTVYAQGIKTPATVTIPLSKSPYRLELIKSDRTPAYKGNFGFTNENKDMVKVLTWGEGTPFITGNYYLLGSKAYLSTEMPGVSYSRIADATLSSMRLYNGFTTSLAKSALFILDDNGAKSLLPAFSILLINQEVRVGGALLPFLDVDALATYTWYPSLSGLLKFTHMSGHEVFLGAEFSSRMKVFNANIKTGMLGFFGGKAHILNDRKDGFKAHDPYPQPIQFVISVGFTLGAGDCRGQNILRVF